MRSRRIPRQPSGLRREERFFITSSVSIRTEPLDLHFDQQAFGYLYGSFAGKEYKIVYLSPATIIFHSSFIMKLVKISGHIKE